MHGLPARADRPGPEVRSASTGAGQPPRPAVGADPARGEPSWPGRPDWLRTRNVAGDFGHGAAALRRVVATGVLVPAVAAGISAAAPVIQHWRLGSRGIGEDGP